MSERRLVGYLRVAPREKPGDRPDIAEQRASIEAAAQASGWTVVGFEQDRRSGRSTRRAGLAAALQMARAGTVDGIVVSRLDRLTYSLPALAELLREATRGGFTLVALDEGLDTASEGGALVARIFGVAATWTPRPVEVNPGQLLGRRGRPSSTPRVVAERIRSLRADGLSLQAICDTLNAEGVPTPRGGARWRPTSLRAILRDAPSD
ncbi:MAG: recombinase family protein [Thermoleophilia bacterium]|nr:recombinase family protein [Thermoleophilia bacterium]MDH3725339.1 recombinase family protein [Thermoleophilia bacterium]